MFYKNIRFQRIRRRRKNKNKNQIIFQNKFGISFWVAVLTLAIFLNIQNIPACNAAASGITSEKLVELTNQSRIEQGIEKLTVNQNLISAANSKARDMFEHNYFAHTSPQEFTPWHWIRQAGYSYQYAGENLAMDFVTSEAVHKALIASATHRKNILNANYKEIGIAVLSGNFEDRQTIIIVQMFGAAIQTIEKQKSNIDSNPPVIKKPTVASASTNINKFPAAAEKINKPAVPNNNLVGLNKKELTPPFNNDANLNSYQNKRALILPIEPDKSKPDKKELIFEKKENNFIPPFNKNGQLLLSQNFKSSHFYKGACLSGRQGVRGILEINSNGRIKNTSNDSEEDFVGQHSFVILNLFQDLFQDFNCQISRFRNKFGMTMGKFRMTDRFFFEISEYLSCFVSGGKINAYVK